MSESSRNRPRAAAATHRSGQANLATRLITLLDRGVHCQTGVRFIVPALLSLAGCTIEVSYVGTHYRCGDGRGCPASFECVDGVCEVDPDAIVPSGDGGPDQGEAVVVSAGPFTMGCTVATDPACDADDAPAQTVTLEAFSIDRLEVTVAAYAACVAASGCPVPNFAWTNQAEWMSPSQRRPIVHVTWEQAGAYCAWRGGRLPTETEWEKAARGQGDRVYPWGDAAPTCALANGEICGRELDDVGVRPAGASPYGVLDLAGNVWEWTGDFYSEEIASAGDRYVVRRGGSHTSDPGELRISNRNDGLSQTGYGDVGFRCAGAP